MALSARTASGVSRGSGSATASIVPGPGLSRLTPSAWASRSRTSADRAGTCAGSPHPDQESCGYGSAGRPRAMACSPDRILCGQQEEAKDPEESMSERVLDGLMMDDFPLTLTAVVERAEQLSGARKVVSRRPNGELHRTTLGECAERARRLASGLAELGIGDGDPVAT